MPGVQRRRANRGFAPVFKLDPCLVLDGVLFCGLPNGFRLTRQGIKTIGNVFRLDFGVGNRKPFNPVQDFLFIVYLILPKRQIEFFPFRIRSIRIQVKPYLYIFWSYPRFRGTVVNLRVEF